MISETILLDLVEETVPSGTARNLLYETPAMAALLFRWLPPMAQHTLLRLLPVAGPLPFAELRSWPTEIGGRQAQSKALLRLTQLGILHGQNREVFLNEHLQRGLLACLQGCLRAKNHFQDSDDKWLQLLLYLAGSQSRTSGRIQTLLEQSGLQAEGKITQRGFQFLLSPTHQQAWLLLSEAIRQQADPAECLTTLATLIWTGSIKAASPLFPLLRELGFVNSHGQATALCSNLASPTALGEQEGEISGQVIVETNFKLYAYPRDELQPAILALFARVHDRLPGLIYASLTQDSVKGAMARGITATQIIRYLTIHAHPVMKRRLQTTATSAAEANVQAGLGGHVLPHTVIDQLTLWERDRERVKSLAGHLYQDFLQAAHFEAFVAEAKRLNCLLYSHGAKRLAVVSRDGHLKMKDWVREHIKN